MTPIENLRARWRPEWSERTDLKRLHGALHQALHVIESVPAKRASLAKSGQLSEKGLNDAMREVAASKVVPELRRGAWEAEKAAGGIKNDWLRLKVPAPEKTDVAGAMLRSEIRTFLRGMDQGERVNAILSNPAFMVAAYEGPAALSGLTDDLRADLEKRMIESVHGEAVDLIEDAEEAVALTTSAIEMAIGVLKREAGFGSDDHAFDMWMRGVSADVEREIAAEKTRPGGERVGSITPAPSREAVSESVDEIFARLTADIPVYRFRDGELVRVDPAQEVAA